MPYIGKLSDHMGYLPKTIFIASLCFFIQKPVCCFVPFQEQRYLRVLNAGTRSSPSGLQKSLHLYRSYFFVKTLYLLNTNLFMLLKRNKAYSGSLNEQKKCQK